MNPETVLLGKEVDSDYYEEQQGVTLKKRHPDQ